MPSQTTHTTPKMGHRTHWPRRKNSNTARNATMSTVDWLSPTATPTIAMANTKKPPLATLPQHESAQRQPPGHWERLAFQRHCVHRLVRDQQVCNRDHHKEQDQCGLPRSSPDHNADTHPREHQEQNVKRHRVD